MTCLGETVEAGCSLRGGSEGIWSCDIGRFVCLVCTLNMATRSRRQSISARWAQSVQGRRKAKGDIYHADC